MAQTNTQRTQGPPGRGGRGRGRGNYFTSSRIYRKDMGNNIVPEGNVLDSVRPYSAETAPTTRRWTSSASKTKLSATAGQYVGSYNWSETCHATILVPGRPPRWSPPSRIPTLREDDGSYFRDNNGARWPRYPSEPLVRTLYVQNPQFDPSNIDVVGCGSTLGNLLRFARGLEFSFHFKAELVGQTLFLVRQENPPTALLQGVYGYGHTYPEAYTTWDAEVKGSASHQRMVTYELEDLTILVRSESDGYLPSKLPKIWAPSVAVYNGNADNQSMDDLLSTFRASLVTPKKPEPGTKLTVRRTEMDPVPQEAVFDIKTRSARYEYDFDEILPRLWLSRTPNFVLAQHVQGKFHEPRIIDIRQQVIEWEAQNQVALRRFVAILRYLHGTLSTLESPKVGIWRVGTHQLEIRSLLDERWSALSPGLKRKWTGGSSNDGGGDGKNEDQSEGDLVLGF